jgi:hypothetical protein
MLERLQLVLHAGRPQLEIGDGRLTQAVGQHEVRLRMQRAQQVDGVGQRRGRGGRAGLGLRAAAAQQPAVDDFQPHTRTR